MTVTPSTPFTPITRHSRVNSKSPSERRSVSPKRRASARKADRRKATPASKQRKPAVATPVCAATQSPSPRATEASTPFLVSRSRAASPTETSVVILDWDDTLLCSTYLASLGYRLEVEQEFSPKLRQELDVIEAQVIRVLEAMIQMVGAANLVIITNAERGWVELSAKKFIPGVIPTLEKCHVVSARSTFEITGSGPFEWKMLAFYHKIQQSFGFRIPPPLLDPRSPYVGYLQHLYENGDSLRTTEECCDSSAPEYGRQKTNYRNLPGVADADAGDASDEESSSVLSEADTDQSLHVLPGGGNSHPDKENALDGGEAKPPRSMLLDDQDNYRESDDFESANEPSFLGQIPPYHLHDSNLVFQLDSNHEEIIQQTKYVVSFGDSLAEKHAAYGVVQNMPNTTLKTIKFLERPSSRQLSEQLTLVEQYLDYILECRRPLDIVLNPESNYK